MRKLNIRDALGQNNDYDDVLKVTLLTIDVFTLEIVQCAVI